MWFKTSGTRLRKACEQGDIDAARRLVAKGVDVNARSWIGGRTALMIASASNQFEMVNYLLEETSASVKTTDGDGMEVLRYAENPEMVALLLEKGAEIDAIDKKGRTALHEACWRPDVAVASSLIQAGARIDIVDEYGDKALHEVIRAVYKNLDTRGAVRLLQDLVSRGAEWDPLCEDMVDGSYGDIGDGFDVSPRELRWRRIGPAVGFLVKHWIALHRTGFPLTPVPEEEIERGLAATQKYLTEIGVSSNTVRRRTVCVVGPSTVGKTSLIKSLIKKGVSLEDIADRTIGIEHFQLKFEELVGTRPTMPRKHEVTFSDFAGQDVYQGMHSLFFTKRTLFFICIDLKAYSVALLKREMLTQDSSKLQHMMNEYVDRTVLRWIRIIFARQPESEFVFVGTKDDALVGGLGVDKIEVLDHVNMMLGRVMAIVEDMRQELRNAEARERSTVQRDATPITHLWDKRLVKCHKPPVKMIVTNSTTASSVAQLESDIKHVIVESGQSYEMPEKYTRVLEALKKRRSDAKNLPVDARIHATFVDVKDLIDELQLEVPDLNEETAKIILQSLRDCVDILWYEDLEDERLQTTVMLDPPLLIEFLRQVINHKHATGTIYHSHLSSAKYWKELNADNDAMLMMKRLLHDFHLVHPTSGPMRFGSDLIVPAFWKTNPYAVWIFGGEDLRLSTRGDLHSDHALRRVHWEFRFTHYLPETLFDHLVVASYSPSGGLEGGPDWILYRDGELAACRVVVCRHWKTHERSLHLEAVVATPDGDARSVLLWTIFTRMCKALARVLKEHPGLPVTNLAHTTDPLRQPTLDSILDAIRDNVMGDETWMPPSATSSDCLHRLVGGASSKRNISRAQDLRRGGHSRRR